MLSRPTDTAGGPEAKVAGLELRVLTAADAREYAATVGTDSPGTFRRRLGGDATCYGVYLDGGLVHSSWVTTGCAWTREIDGYVCAATSSPYVYESFTHPRARGKGVYPFALGAICDALAARAIPLLWVAVESSNEASLRAVAKAGFTETFRIDHARKLGRVTIRVPQEVKTDTSVRSLLKKRRIWLPGDGAGKQWKP